MTSILETGKLLTPAEVAARFQVTVQTVSRWAREGRLTRVRLPGGSWRYRESEVNRLRGSS